MAEKKTPIKKTPANNAGTDVVDDEPKTGCCYEGGCPECRDLITDQRPEFRFPATAENRDVLDTAELFRRSGWFGTKTTAQLATLIVVGETLGMDPGQSVFDLEISGGEIPAIAYRRRQTFSETKDDVEAERAALKSIADRTTSTPALAAVPDPPAGSKVVHLEGRADGSTFVKTADGQTRDTAKGEDVSELLAADPAGSFQKIANSANSGPVSENDAQAADEPAPIDPSPVNSQARAGSDVPADETQGSETLNSALSTAAAAEGVGDVGSDTVNAWRSSIAEFCAELGIDADEKLKTFDASKLPAKKKMFDDARKYYVGKIDTARGYVLARLAEDGKTTTEAQKGFFLYAEVPLDPAAWTYPDAAKAEAAISDFLKSKGEPKTPAAAAAPKATNVADLVTAKQLGMIRAIAREAKVDADKECSILMNCTIDELSKRAASDLIERLQEMQRANAAPMRRA